MYPYHLILHTYIHTHITHSPTHPLVTIVDHHHHHHHHYFLILIAISAITRCKKSQAMVMMYPMYTVGYVMSQPL